MRKTNLTIPKCADPILSGFRKTMLVVFVAFKIQFLRISISANPRNIHNTKFIKAHMEY